MRASWRLALALGLLPAAPAMALPPPTLAEPSPDPLLASLIREALAQNPELARNAALTEAERERIPQAGALPDPSLSLGLQNDGFKRLQIGRMENSYYQIALTQGLPWPGKRGLRSEVARLGAESLAAQNSRTRLTLEADVKRAYASLLLVRSQLRLLETQTLFLQQGEAIARTRYEVGQGSQADLLRAQLERTRLNQARFSLQSEERTALAALNRLRARPSATPIPTERSFEDGTPQAIDARELQAKAEETSPELRAAALGVNQAERSLDLAKLDRRPDFAVTAALMPRGGLDPMWGLGVSISLPAWSKQKQHHAVAEQEQRRRAQGSDLENQKLLLRQRLEERAAQMDAALETLTLYRSGLLVQSEASFRATLAQYEAGRVPFLSVLEALKGWISDQSGLLQAQAQALAIQIAQEELNPGPTPPIGATTLTAAPMAAGGGGAKASGASRTEKAVSGGDSGGSAMKTM
ncbi:MAG: outer rane efflux protein [Holophagaceae bacterium]|nr:outer rane efflux protein [Holophagaceae bacterium]